MLLTEVFDDFRVHQFGTILAGHQQRFGAALFVAFDQAACDIRTHTVVANPGIVHERHEALLPDFAFDRVDILDRIFLQLRGDAIEIAHNDRDFFLALSFFNTGQRVF